MLGHKTFPKLFQSDALQAPKIKPATVAPRNCLIARPSFIDRFNPREKARL
jgi:hypothetical protein